MELGDRAVVIDDRPGVGALGLGPAALGVEELIERDGAGIVRRLHRLHLPLGGDPPIEVGLGEREIRVDVPHRLDERVRGLELFVLEPSPLACQLQLLVADGRKLTPEADRHQELGLGLPLLELSAHECRVGIRVLECDGVGIHSGGCVRGIRATAEQILTDAEEPPPAAHVEPRQEQVLGRGQLQFLLLDDPLLAAELRRPRQRLHKRLLPVEGDAGRRRLVGRPDEPPVARREAHHVAKAIFAAIHIGEGLLHFAAEKEILLAGLGLFVGLAAPRLFHVERVNFPPRFERAIAAHLAGLEIPVGEIQLPIRLLGVADEVSHAGLEVGE